jgi:hypothetical protein
LQKLASNWYEKEQQNLSEFFYVFDIKMKSGEKRKG